MIDENYQDKATLSQYHMISHVIFITKYINEHIIMDRKLVAFTLFFGFAIILTSKILDNCCFFSVCSLFSLGDKSGFLSQPKNWCYFISTNYRYLLIFLFIWNIPSTKLLLRPVIKIWCIIPVKIINL